MQIVLYYSDKDTKAIERAKRQARAAGISTSRLFINAIVAISDRKPVPKQERPQ